MAGLILIVDDDDMTLTLLRDVLEADGYNVIEAENGEKAIESAIKEKPDLIMMDIQMPVMSGLEATRILKADAATRMIPIIAVTALAMKGQDQVSLEAGCDSYVSKPFKLDVLCGKVRDYLGWN